MKKKMTSDKNGTAITIGDWVFFDGARLYLDPPIWHRTLGKVNSINGAYIVVGEALVKQSIWELYPNEIEKATEEKATLWMLEN
jgi:hypothetical protein